MSKKFPIPNLTQENWDAIQDSLNSIGRIIADMDDKETDLQKKKDLEVVSIHLGMIDMYLGRHYTLDEVTENLSKIKEETLDDKAKRLFEYQSKIWVLYCGPNLGDYYNDFVDKSGYEVLKHCIVNVFTSFNSLNQYASEHNIQIM